MKSGPTKIATFTFDPASPSRPTAEEKARFVALRDEDIDYSDIPDQGKRTDWTRPGLLTVAEPGKKKKPAA